jgi:hypothetical protein
MKEGFFWAKDLNGSKVPILYPYEIDGSTAIERGEVVLFTPSTGIEAVSGTDFNDPAIGVAVEFFDRAG